MVVLRKDLNGWYLLDFETNEKDYVKLDQNNESNRDNIVFTLTKTSKVGVFSGVNITIKPEYDSIKLISDDVRIGGKWFCAKKGNEYHIYNAKYFESVRQKKIFHEEIVGLIFDYHSFLYETKPLYFIFRKEGLNGILNQNGDVVLPAEYLSINGRLNAGLIPKIQRNRIMAGYHYFIIIGQKNTYNWHLLHLLGNQILLDKQLYLPDGYEPHFNGYDKVKCIEISNSKSKGAISTLGTELIKCNVDSSIIIDTSKEYIGYDDTYQYILARDGEIQRKISWAEIRDNERMYEEPMSREDSLYYGFDGCSDATWGIID